MHPFGTVTVIDPKTDSAVATVETGGKLERPSKNRYRSSYSAVSATFLGHNNHIRPDSRILPASFAASGPNPQKKSARTAPRMAPPVSCAMTRRCSASSDAGKVVARNTGAPRDRKSTRLNSSHSQISYAVFCLKKKKKTLLLICLQALLGLLDAVYSDASPDTSQCS